MIPLNGQLPGAPTTILFSNTYSLLKSDVGSKQLSVNVGRISYQRILLAQKYPTATTRFSGDYAHESGRDQTCWPSLFLPEGTGILGVFGSHFQRDQSVPGGRPDFLSHGKHCSQRAASWRVYWPILWSRLSEEICPWERSTTCSLEVPPTLRLEPPSLEGCLFCSQRGRGNHSRATARAAPALTFQDDFKYNSRLTIESGPPLGVQRSAY